MEPRKLTPQYGPLVAGKRYRVAQTFTDYDGIERREGEVWTFLGSSFLPYESGLSLFFTIGGKTEQVRLQAIEEEQLYITNNLPAWFVEHKSRWRLW